MDDKRANIAVLVLIFLPVYIAISKIVVEFNVIEFGYLLLVAILFLNYFYKEKIKTKKKNKG